MILKIRHLILASLFLLAGATAAAQVITEPIFSQFKLEARADFDLQVVDDGAGGHNFPRGFNGRYFNLLVGGNLTPDVSYYFRQRIIAKEGSTSLFDNTDFLYINYRASEHWMFRLGKDAIAVGGFEYDAPPIDVLFSTYYWDNFYCFQIGGSVAYHSTDGKHTLMAQVSNSPYIHYGAYGIGNQGNEWSHGLLGYSLFYSGNIGHLRMLHSVNLFERPDNGYMNYIAIGHKLVYDRWDIYLDLIHHAHDWNDWGNNFAVVSCMNFQITKQLNFFAKGAYEQNRSDRAISNFEGALGLFDCLIGVGESYTTLGIGFELRPAFCRDLKLHGFVANQHHTELTKASTDKIFFNAGIMWDMDIHNIVMQRMKH